MASQRPLAHCYQHSHWYSKVRKSEDRSTSPSAEPETFLARTSLTPSTLSSSDPNLFNSLLLNREVVYHDSSTSLYSATSKPVSDKSLSAIETPRDGLDDAHQDFSFAHTRGEINQNLGRSNVPGMLAYLKANQIRSITRGRVNPGKSMATKTRAKNKEDKPQKRSASRTFPRASKSRKTGSTSHEALKSKTTHNLVRGKPLASSSTGDLSDDDDDSEDMQLEVEWLSTRRKDDQTSTELRRELEAAKAETDNLRRRNAQLERELNDEHEFSRVVVKERDQLRIEVNLSRSEHDELTAKYQDLQHRHVQARTDHEIIVEDIIKTRDLDTKSVQEVQGQVRTLKEENTRLIKENETLKATTTSLSPHRSTLSPTLSSISSDKEKKTDNIRKTYVMVKRRYDHLHKAANDLSTCTRSVDLSCFGEFGQNLKHLRSVLEEDSKEKQAYLVHGQSQYEN
ncbi:hypothetical protein N0V83_008374 [Neocucurbitaria cava]|uniref:Uncharacterized protein n=1 Tax=Neocucurbitaria cava TaxID=798079 RepID=A0A9W8Y1V6_9PLEO|nr:hypothetical protein N0V83_008374 [Neocucurbitaria cava]